VPRFVVSSRRSAMMLSDRAPLSGEPSQAGTAGALTDVDHAMARYADGDDAAFSVVFNGLTPRLRAFLRRLGAAEDVASDLTQETFIRMHRARGSFARGAGVVPWAYAIARNCFVSHLRSARVKASRRSVDIDEHAESIGLAASAEETTSAKQSAAVVERALAQMSDINREAFVLIRFEGQSVAAAAQILGATEGAVKLRAFRAYELLRAALERADASSGKGAGPGARS
jgi:RNA polymerase sigma-70 factor (ECF subfamily)